MRLSAMLQGLVPPAPVDYELSLHGLRKIAKVFIEGDELKCVLVTDRGSVQEAKVADYVAKLPRYHFDGLMATEGDREKFEQLWELYYGSPV
jgi:hypothetical protein